MSAKQTEEKETITFRIPAKKRAELDRIAKIALRDRSFVLNEAVSAYIEVSRYHEAHIEQGLKEACAGKFSTDAEVARAYRGT